MIDPIEATSASDDNALLSAWQKTLAQRKDGPAIFSTRGSVLRTFAQIEAESRAAGKILEALPSRSVVGVWLGNNERWPALLLALWRRRLIPLPLGCHMQPAELETALAACRASALLKIENGQPTLLRTGQTDVQGEWPDAVTDFLKLTSGTTSLPRAVRFRAGQLLADCENICATMGITPDDINFGVIPFSHSYGFSHLITPLIACGTRLCVSDDRIPRAILEGLAQTEATVFPATPVFFQKLGHLDKAPKLRKLRLCISAGAPLLRTAAEPFSDRFGLKIHTFYGASECGGITYDATEEPIYEDGFMGTTMRGVSVTHSSDEIGSIIVRGSAVGEGYFPDDECALGSGQFIPGDLIQKTDRGLYLAGRVSDVINVAGRKLNPLEVEAKLTEFPGVKQAVVFGVRSELRGEEPVACVAGQGLDRDSLLRFCREKLSPWQMPRDLWLVDEIPVNERGKISRRALAESYGLRAA